MGEAGIARHDSKPLRLAATCEKQDSDSLLAAHLPSSLVNSDQTRFGKKVLARLALHVLTTWRLRHGQVSGRQSEKMKMIMVRSVATRRARPSIARPVKVIDALLEPLSFRVLGSTRRELPLLGRNVIGRPMMPNSAWRIGVMAEKNEAKRSRRNTVPIKRRRHVFTVACELLRDDFPIFECIRSQLHDSSPIGKAPISRHPDNLCHLEILTLMKVKTSRPMPS